MDGSRFDALAKTLSVPDTRRRVLGLLAAVPLLGGLVGVLHPEEAEAKDRRRRRKQRHKTRKDKRPGKGKRKQGCKPQTQAQVCAGKCGAVKTRQTCGKTVDCGACDCSPACGECFTCQGAAGALGTCVPQAGAPCGEAATCTGGVLQPRGTCNGNGVCQPAAPISCEPYRGCAGNACATSCAGESDCVNGSFCQDGVCVGDREDGASCTHDGQCASGHCVDDVCCDTACDGECQACTLTGFVGTCTPRDSGTPCGQAVTCTDDTLYPQSSCDGHGTCEEADPVSCAPYRCDGSACATSCRGEADCATGYFCNTDQGTCDLERTNGEVCNRDGQCVSGHCVDGVCCNSACDGECEACNLIGSVGTCTTQANGETCGSGLICCSGRCRECCDRSDCSGDALCVEGVCHACNVPCAGDAAACGDALRTALAGDKPFLYLCPGTYQGGFTISRDVTITGAGEGENPASNTVLDGNDTRQVVYISSGNVTLLRLHITRGNGSGDGTGRPGGGIWNEGGTLTMENTTVAGNRAWTAGGIYSEGTLIMDRCVVRDNHARNAMSATVGGGLRLDGAASLTDCLISDNTVGGEGGGIYLGSDASLVLAGASVIEQNTAGLGGGIYSTAEAPGSVQIGEACQITSNTAFQGSGIWNGGAAVILEGTDDPSPIVTNNCQQNCYGDVPRCAEEPVSCPG